MGVERSRIKVTGCPSVDLLVQVSREGSCEPDMRFLEEGVGYPVDLHQPYLIVLLHPVTTEFIDVQRQTEEVLSAVAASELQVLWFWPNNDAGSGVVAGAIRHFREQHPDYPIRFVRNTAPKAFVKLMIDSNVIVGNSSVGIREAAFLGVPAVNIGTRQHNREHGPNVITVEP
jgi:UDP-N-acetylglucosamine 2-epimerase